MTKHSFKVWRNRRIILHTRRRKIIVLALKMWQICSYEVVYEFCYSGYISFDRGFPSGSVVKNPSAMQEMWVWFLVQEIPGERNGNPLQYSCLENPMDRGVWRATVHGCKSRTRLNHNHNQPQPAIHSFCKAIFWAPADLPGSTLGLLLGGRRGWALSVGTGQAWPHLHPEHCTDLRELPLAPQISRPREVEPSWERKRRMGVIPVFLNP